jgi:hypothetical protein
VFFSSWSLPAAPGHRFPRAVWLQGARPFANLAHSGVFEQPLQKHKVLAIGRRRNTVNYEVSVTRGTPKYIKKVATPRVYTRFARTAAGTETIIIHGNLVKHEVSEATVLTNPYKTSYQARFARLRAPRPVTKPTNSNDDLQNFAKRKVSEPTCFSDLVKTLFHTRFCGLAGVLVSCWGLGVLLGSWCLAGASVSCWGLGVVPGGLATITPPTSFLIDLGAV